LPVVLLVAPSVAEVLAQARADADLVVGRDGDVAAIEERVELLREQEPVLRMVRARAAMMQPIGRVSTSSGASFLARNFTMRLRKPSHVASPLRSPKVVQASASGRTQWLA